MSQNRVTGSIETTLRPLRIAFVIKPGDRASALQAIRLSSFLWGGTFNPILQYYRRLPSNSPQYEGAESAKVVFGGLLNAYDPDFVVRLGDAKNYDISFGNRTEIDESELKGKAEDDFEPGYGVGLFKILQNLLDEEFRYHHRNPITLNQPEVGDNLFWNAVFGGLNPELQAAYDEAMANFPESEKVPCINADCYGCFEPNNLFLRRLTSHHLDYRIRRFRNDWIFIGDERNLEDVLTYWNLRALGWSMFPVPTSLAKDPAVIQKAADYVRQCFWPHRYNRSLFNSATLFKGPSVAASDHEDFADEIARLLPPQKGPEGPALTLQSWLPRIWNDSDRRYDLGDGGPQWTTSRDTQMNPITRRFEVKALTPAFLKGYRSGSGPCCANEIQLRSYDDTGKFAEVIPEGTEEMVRALDILPTDDARCSRNGLVFYPDHPTSTLFLSFPKSEPLFRAWFRERGWNFSLSDNGSITRHLIQQLGGLWGSKNLTEEGVLELVYKVSREDWLSEEEFRAETNRCGSKGGPKAAEILRQWMIESGIVKLGAVLQCPDCRQRSWHSVTEMDYELECRQCLGKFRLPSEAPKKINWAYRGNGAFASKEGTQGSLPVILALRLFTKGMHLQTTGIFSSNLSRGPEEMEIDLGMMTRRFMSDDPEHELLFFECKSYNAFEKRDIERMEKFTQGLPGSVIVFATLRRALRPKEKKLLAQVERRSRKKRKRGHSFSPLIILTGNELFSPWDPWVTWGQLKGNFAKVSSWRGGENQMQSLAQATQKLYLDLDPFHN